MLWYIIGCVGLIAAFALAGLLIRLWLLFPLQSRSVTLLYAEASGDSLEQNVRAYLFLKKLGLLQAPIYIIDAGLDENGRSLAQKLLALDRSIQLCRVEDLDLSQTLEQRGTHPWSKN